MVVKEERVTALWLSGAIGFGTVYLAGIVVTAAVAEEDVGLAIGYASIPVFGWGVMLADLPMTGGQVAATAIAGVLQLASAGMVIAGLIYKRPVAVPAYPLGAAASSPLLSITPSVMDGRGLGVQLAITRF